LSSFILPGGHPAVSYAHVGRTVCRRAERCVLRLANSEDVNEGLIKYLNRLSDYLFILARKTASDTGSEQSKWIP
jgi:cob(I)alamin adenosyltransferase